MQERGGGVDEFGRSGKDDFAAIGNIFAEIGKRLQIVLVGDILAQRNRPGVVCRRWCQPDDLVGVEVECFRLFIALGCIFPERIVGLGEKKAALPVYSG